MELPLYMRRISNSSRPLDKMQHNDIARSRDEPVWISYRDAYYILTDRLQTGDTSQCKQWCLLLLAQHNIPRYWRLKVLIFMSRITKDNQAFRREADALLAYCRSRIDPGKDKRAEEIFDDFGVQLDALGCAF